MAEPAVQALVSLESLVGGGEVLGLVVSPRFSAAPVAIEVDGAAREVALDAAGVAVVTAAQTAGMTAVLLDDGAVRCPVVDPGSGQFEDVGPADPDLDDPEPDDPDDPDVAVPSDGMGALVGMLGLGPCVRR